VFGGLLFYEFVLHTFLLGTSIYLTLASLINSFKTSTFLLYFPWSEFFLLFLPNCFRTIHFVSDITK
jgi:hypothetical protein